METLFRDLRLALRSAARLPTLTAIVVVTLALGIGANTAIFSMIQAVLLAPLDYQEPERLVTLWQDYTEREGPVDEWYSWPNFDDHRRLSESFSTMAAISGWQPTLTGEGEAEQLLGARASWTLFEALGREPVLGRAFVADEDAAEAENVVLLGSAFWQRRFGGDPGVLDRVIRFQGEPWRVIGVLPPGFEVPFEGAPDVLAPLAISESNTCGRGCVNLRVVGRLADGVTIDQAREELASLARALEEEYPEDNEGIGAYLEPLHSRVTGRVRTPLLLLLGAVGLVLLIATANVASLQLTRALHRRDELAMRAALGASRGQIVQQLLVESLALALLGGVAGLGVAVAGIQLLKRLAADAAPRLAEASLDYRTVGFAAVVTLVTGLLFGALPALRAARFDLYSQLKEGDGGRGGGRTRSALVVAEVALATLLLVGAGLLGRSLLALFQLDLGYRTDNVLLARVGLGGEAYQEREAKFAFAESVLERLRATPGVEKVSHTNSPPLLGFDGDSNFDIEGRAAQGPGKDPVGWLRVVDEDYFDTLGVRVLEGRGFTAADRDGAALVVMLNETAAKRYFADDPSGAVGQRVNFNRDVQWRDVVGVVADTRHFGVTEPERPAVYLPWKQSPFGSPYFLIRTDSDPLAMVPALRAAVGELDSNLAVAGVDTMDHVVGDAISTERLLVALLGLFAACALLMASIGLYGVMSHAVEQRRRELGIRLALGADGGRLRRMVLRGGLLLVGVGLVLGLLAAAGLGRLLESVLYGVSPWDAVTFLVVPLVLAAVGVLALWMPARKASRADVITVLRYE